MFELSADQPIPKQREIVKNPSRLTRLSNEVINKNIDHLWKLSVVNHPITENVRQDLKKIIEKAKTNLPKEMDQYWNHFCDILPDHFYRMVAFTTIQQDVFGFAPKDILQYYLDHIFRQQKSQNQRKNLESKKKFFPKIDHTFDEFVGPADLIALTKDPISEVLDPGKFVDRTPNCIQVSTVFARIFSAIGHPSVPMSYSSNAMPHVGILLMDKDDLLRYDKNPSVNVPHASVVKQNSRASFIEWRRKLSNK